MSTMEDLRTYPARVEAILNSRPISHCVKENNFEVITFGHFFTGQNSRFSGEAYISSKEYQAICKL